MKKFKYLLMILVSVAAMSCGEEVLLKTGEDDDDPIIIPPPKPPGQNGIVIQPDTLDV